MKNSVLRPPPTTCLRVAAFACLIFSLLPLLTQCEDYYELLGISKSATNKEIRKAFKKLALTMHPDKKQDDPDAHDNFIKINRAYEVLKDDELRKKYDMHGEEGLKENFNRGRHYESWNFYHEEFGLYDDDPEIITLSRTDFGSSVEDSGDVWFINFYSQHCSHCHVLAPTWREMARELEGIVRIGAINCQDDWQLCQMQGVRSYPSLLMYPQREKYHGARTTEALVQYALKNVHVQYFVLWSGNFKSKMADEDNTLPWLITFCGGDGDCLLPQTCLKLAGMLDGLANVGSIDCAEHASLCQNLDQESGTYYYKHGEVKAGKGMEVTSLITKEIAFQVLSQLPDMTLLDRQALEEIEESLASDSSDKEVWVIHFIDTEVHDLEFRKLPVMLDNLNIGRVDCRDEDVKPECKRLHIMQFPAILVFKPTGGHEFYYGRMTAHDIAAFARDSAITKVETLSSRDFPHRVINSADPWFVDFFAPWCPPCMRLLPEFRRAAKDIGNTINFGTVDCTIHLELCRNYNIHSYPTTIFYNQSIPHQYHGHHNAKHIVEFIQDTMDPPVVVLTETSFANEVDNKDPDSIWLVDFFAPWCGPCQQLAPEWRSLAKMLKSNKNLHVAQVDCQSNRNLCQRNQVNSYPTMRLYPMGKFTGRYFMFQGWHRDAQSLRAWVYEFLPSLVIVVDWRKFNEEILPSQDPWIVDFYAPWCGHCQVFKPEFDKLAENLEGRVKAGKVNCDEQTHLCQQAGVRAYPSIRYYAGSKSIRQNINGVDINSQNGDEILRFIEKQLPTKRHDEL